MQIEWLWLRDFRNIASLEADFERGIHLITGNNGHGKTNLIEALFILSAGRSFRTRKIVELIRRGGQAASVRGRFRGVSLAHKIAFVFQPGNKRITADGKKPRSTLEWAGRISFVLYAPESVKLIQGSPGGRRDFVDRAIFDLHGGYLKVVKEYQKALSQRNAILRQGRADNRALLEAWSERLALVGAKIVRFRFRYLARLGEAVKPILVELTGEDRVIDVRYQVNTAREASSGGEKEIAKSLLNGYEKTLERDRTQGTTGVGPHRDEVALLLDGHDIKTYASTAQVRLAILSIKLAEGGIYKETKGATPVYLLDDLFAYFDKERRKRVLAALEPAEQVFITGADFDDSAPALCRAAGLYEMSEGALRRKSL